MTTYTAKQYEEAEQHFRMAERALRVAKQAEKALDSWSSYRGAEFKVVRGRKFPIGTVARADFIGSNDFGPYVRFTLNGQTQFISERNVEWPEFTVKREAVYADLNAAEEAVKAARRLVVEMAGIDLSKPLERGKLSQMAYSDSYVAEYACNADAPDDVLRAAVDILDPPQSSWGALRWSQGSSIQSRDGGTVTIASYTGICD